jgi:hypothetical protein
VRRQLLAVEMLQALEIVYATIVMYNSFSRAILLRVPVMFEDCCELWVKASMGKTMQGQPPKWERRKRTLGRLTRRVVV